MNTKYLDILDNFDKNSLPNLDIVTLGALELFSQTSLPQIKTTYKRPLVVGSGNAEATSRIIFEDRDAIFASESTFEEKLKNIDSIDSVVVVSASGSKHAPIIVDKALQSIKPVTLITNTENSPAKQQFSNSELYEEFVFPKNREPYTYNTSTYMGMILGKTGESSTDIYQHINNNLDWLKDYDFSKFDKFVLVIPPEFANISKMLEVKFIELFGRKVARDVATLEYMKHATTVVPTDELYVYFGIESENQHWGDDQHKLFIPLPEKSNYASMMAVGYYTIGQIQKQHPPYFKENIQNYIDFSNSTFGSSLSVIVE